jgi:putative transposase
VPIQELVRKAGISDKTFYRWKRRFAGMGVVGLHRLRQLEEDRKLKQLVTDHSLDEIMLGSVACKSAHNKVRWSGPSDRTSNRVAECR